MSAREGGEQERPHTAEAYDIIGRTKALHKRLIMGKGVSQESPLEFCPQLGAGTHSVLAQLLECIWQAARLVEDEVKVLEAGGRTCLPFRQVLAVPRPLKQQSLSWWG